VGIEGKLGGAGRPAVGSEQGEVEVTPSSRLRQCCGGGPYLFEQHRGRNSRDGLVIRHGRCSSSAQQLSRVDPGSLQQLKPATPVLERMESLGQHLHVPANPGAKPST